MAGIKLITSGTYVGQELAAEFGQIPPAFLPTGVNALYEAQIARFGEGQTTYLSIPENFQPKPYDQKRFKELGITTISTPNGLSLGESIIFALNYIDVIYDSIEILHGDTLIEDLPNGEFDCIAIHSKGDDYSWAFVELDQNVVISLKNIDNSKNERADLPVVCGYFSFSNARLLIRSITRARGDFVGGLDLYTREQPLRAIDVNGWKDFGHIQTYFRSRRSINTARSFNAVELDELIAKKTSSDHAKISAEAKWLNSVPPEVQPYTARLIQDNTDFENPFYATEYLYAPTLAELLVFSSIGRSTWRNILASCHAFLNACVASPGPGTSEATIAALAINKTNIRLEQYERETGFSVGTGNLLAGRSMPSLIKIAEQISTLVDLKTHYRNTVMHGDFCFSNILYNSRSARISVIDPRGYTETGIESCYGDVRYDLAKFSHSIHGCYDHIIAGRYKLDKSGKHSFAIDVETSTNHTWLKQAVSELKVLGFSVGSMEIKAITIGLFLSMLPLHADRPDRQDAFIATALRLYSELDGATS